MSLYFHDNGKGKGRQMSKERTRTAIPAATCAESGFDISSACGVMGPLWRKITKTTQYRETSLKSALNPSKAIETPFTRLHTWLSEQQRDNDFQKQKRTHFFLSPFSDQVSQWSWEGFVNISFVSYLGKWKSIAHSFRRVAL